MVLVECGDGKRRSYRLRRQREEVEQFVAFLHAQEQPVRIGFEPTSNYHRTLAYRLPFMDSSSRSPLLLGSASEGHLNSFVTFGRDSPR